MTLSLAGGDGTAASFLLVPPSGHSQVTTSPPTTSEIVTQQVTLHTNLNRKTDSEDNSTKISTNSSANNGDDNRSANSSKGVNTHSEEKVDNDPQNEDYVLHDPSLPTTPVPPPPPPLPSTQSIKPTTPPPQETKKDPISTISTLACPQIIPLPTEHQPDLPGYYEVTCGKEGSFLAMVVAHSYSNPGNYQLSARLWEQLSGVEVARWFVRVEVQELIQVELGRCSYFYKIEIDLYFNSYVERHFDSQEGR